MKKFHKIFGFTDYYFDLAIDLLLSPRKMLYHSSSLGISKNEYEGDISSDDDMNWIQDSIYDYEGRGPTIEITSMRGSLMGDPGTKLFLRWPHFWYRKSTIFSYIRRSLQ